MYSILRRTLVYQLSSDIRSGSTTHKLPRRTLIFQLSLKISRVLAHTNLLILCTLDISAGVLTAHFFLKCQAFLRNDLECLKLRNTQICLEKTEYQKEFYLRFGAAKNKLLQTD